MSRPSSIMTIMTIIAYTRPNSGHMPISRAAMIMAEYFSETDCLKSRSTLPSLFCTWKKSESFLSSTNGTNACTWNNNVPSYLLLSTIRPAKLTLLVNAHALQTVAK